jgi:hypothetical protein
MGGPGAELEKAQQHISDLEQRSATLEAQVAALSAQAPTQVPPLLPEPSCLLPVAAVSNLFVHHACPTPLKVICLCVTILGRATQPFSVPA